MTYPAGDIPGLVEMLDSKGLDFITTNRFAKMDRGAMGAKHRFGNWVLSFTTRVLFSVKIKDSQSGMWVFRRTVLDKLVVESDGMAYSEELKIEAFRKAKAAEVPISYGVRMGEAKISSWGDGLGNLKYLFKKRF